MLTLTSETALRALIYIAHCEKGSVLTPREVAPRLNASPTYLAKITRMLVKSQILESHRGVNGGVSLVRDPKEITLLEITESCQGLLVGNFCRGISEHQRPVCAFHQAMQEIHEATTRILNHYTLADLMQSPKPFREDLLPSLQCKMACMLPELHAPGGSNGTHKNGTR
ncbi:MAG: Rrf2 family transcriptional regulator [Candidatus Sumerlaeia bacterium]|nr:Rrf2 family transcriptional regulator [Candidatus Sumerlaeia bacterium]